jgi:hypothetical protein
MILWASQREGKIVNKLNMFHHKFTIDMSSKCRAHKLVLTKKRRELNEISEREVQSIMD